MIIKLKNENVFRRLSVRRSIPPSVWKVINLKVTIFWILIFEEYSLIVFQHIRRKNGRASYWCFLTKERTFREYGTLAEWLRRGPAKAVGYAFVGISNHSCQYTDLQLVDDNLILSSAHGTFQENFEHIHMKEKCINCTLCIISKRVPTVTHRANPSLIASWFEILFLSQSPPSGETSSVSIIPCVVQKEHLKNEKKNENR